MRKEGTFRLPAETGAETPPPEDRGAVHDEGRGDWLPLLPIGPAARALDLGSEGGALSLGLARLCDQVTAVEPDPRLASITGQRAEQAGLTNVRTLCAPAERLSFRPGSFDVVVVQRPTRVFASLGAREGAALLRHLVASTGCAAVSVGVSPRLPAASPGKGPDRPHRLGISGVFAGRRGFGLRSVRAALWRAGFSDVQAYLALPDPLVATYLLPLEGRRAFRVAADHLARHLLDADAGVERLLLRPAVWLPASGFSLARRLSPGYWLIARPPGSLRASLAEEMLRQVAAQPPAAALRREEGAERIRSLLRHGPASFLVEGGTRGPGAHATYFAFPARWREPGCALRVARHARDGEEASRAQAVLARLREALPPDMRRSVPAPLGVLCLRGHHAAAESCVAGTPLLRALARHRGERGRPLVAEALLEVAGWLADLHHHTASGKRLAGPEARMALCRALAPVPGHEAPELEPDSRFGPALEAIARRGLRLCAAHNSLSARSILLGPTSGIAITDWGLAAFDDLPLLDLLHLGRTLAGHLLAGGAEDAEAAHRFAFGGESWYGHQVAAALARYCEQVELPPDAPRVYLPIYYLRAAAFARGRAAPAEHAALRRLAEVALDEM
ncbi:MAG: class I SAM-dependent methyltransferase [Armatimonadetes bacterium]|nr:class I SAM-dependent methyltransferase [Armatimonadota bacterium]